MLLGQPQIGQLLMTTTPASAMTAPSFVLGPTASFSASPTTVCLGESISFTDTSAGNPTSWNWDFGDGNSSTAQNPTHVYATAGTYDVKLVVSDGTNSDSITKTGYIMINAPPTVDLGSDTTSICQGDSVLLDAGSGHTNYLWSTGETTQTIYASTSGSYSITVGNGTAVSNSNSLTFDGQDDYVSIRRDISTDFSIALWTKTTQVGTTIHSHWFDGKGLVDMEVSGVTNDFGTSLLQSKFAFGTGSPDVTIVSTTDINDGNWHFCVATRKSSTGELKLYVDGVLENTGTGRTGALTASNIIKIGSDNNRGFFLGEIDEVSIWDKVLTADEILKYTFSALNGNESGLVNYWNFNQGSGITITDQTSNGNNGTINGATWSTTTLSLFQHNCITSDTIYVESNSNPTISVSSDQTICAGESATITASGASTYSWSTGETSTSINVSPSANTEYVVTGTDANGCTAKDTVSITVNPLPALDLGNDTTSICQGDSVLLDAGAGHTNYVVQVIPPKRFMRSTSGSYSVTVGNGTLVSNSNSLSFDGQDDYVNTTLNNLSLSTFTVSLDVKNPSNDILGRLFSNGTNNEIVLMFDPTKSYNSDSLINTIRNHEVYCRNGIIS